MMYAQLRQWYAEQARPLLSLHGEQRVQKFDQLLSRLDSTAQQIDSPLTVCFLGNSGVGKSTLLNALVADDATVVPQGGIGPLTAQATLVKYAESRYFEASYFSAEQLNRVLFVLERRLEAQHRRPSGRPAVASDPPSTGAAGDTLTAEGSTPPVSADAQARVASLLIRGDQFADAPPQAGQLEYLADGLRQAMARDSKWGTSLIPDDRARVERLQQVLQAGRQGNGTRCAFRPS